MKIQKSTQKRNGKKGAFHFLCFVVFFAVFFAVIAPWLDKIGLVQPLIRFIDDRNIDATALYYTEIEEFSDAQIFMSNSRQYPPRGEIKAE